MVTAAPVAANLTSYFVEHAKSVVVLLVEEFGTPFVIYEATSGNPSSASDARWHTLGLPGHLQANLVMPESNEPRVVQRAVGCFEVWIPLRECSRTTLVAATLINGFARNSAESEQERLRLTKWAGSVRSRLEHATQTNGARKSSVREEQAAAAWDGLITLENLIRRTRFLSDSDDNNHRILKGINELLGVDAVIWVPQARDSDVIVAGSCQLTVWDSHQFVSRLTVLPDYESAGMLIDNDFKQREFSHQYPSIANLLAIQVGDERMPGCLVAINKRGKQKPAGHSARLNSNPAGNARTLTDPALSPLVSFRRGDAALLTPFLTLMSAQFRAAKRYLELKDLLVSLTRSLTSSIDAKDPYTMGHSERVGRIAAELARGLGMQGEELGDMYLAGLLHDIGKIGIRDAVLQKQGPLTPEETEHVKQHPMIGYQILSDVRAIKHLLPGVLYHHERYDGQGYPHNLKGESIPLLARILAVADSFDAMHTNRPYRQGLSKDHVEKIFREGSGVQWDPQVVEALFRCSAQIHAIRQRGVGESLRHALENVLHDGSSVGTCGALPARIALPA